MNPGQRIADDIAFTPRPPSRSRSFFTIVAFSGVMLSIGPLHFETALVMQRSVRG
jgi:hypothetical protein